MSSKLATTLNAYLNTWIETRKKMSNSQQTTNATLRQMMNSGILGTSIANNAPLVGAINPNTYYATKEMDYITENPMHIKIHRAANGFIVQTAIREGDRHSVHIASTIEQVHEIITTELVTKKLEGK